MARFSLLLNNVRQRLILCLQKHEPVRYVFLPNLKIAKCSLYLEIVVLDERIAPFAGAMKSMIIRVVIITITMFTKCLMFAIIMASPDRYY